MSEPLKKVSPGDPQAIPAGAYSTFVGVARTIVKKARWPHAWRRSMMSATSA